MIHVLLVDDSPIALHLLQRLLTDIPDIQVIGTATNGQEALTLLQSLDPDVICTDLHMPVMNGLELTREVMRSSPRPILVVSVSVEPDSPNVFRLLEAGAVDIYPKPRGLQEAENDAIAHELASKIRIVAGVHVFRRSRPLGSPPIAVTPPESRPHPVRIVAIGASTGGPQALRELLTQLPADFPLPVVCVQHIGAEFLLPLVTWLDEATALSVAVATQGDLPQAGKVYFAPNAANLEFDKQGRFTLTATGPCDGHLPSATVTLQSAAQQYGTGTVGVLLTGMGRDGAAGMAAIAAAGGVTIAQDETSSIVYGMPRAAVALGAVKHVLSLGQIGPMLMALVHKRNAASYTSRG